MRLLLFLLVLSLPVRSQETVTSIAEDIDSAQTMLFDVALNFHDGVPPTDTCVQQLSEALRRVSSLPDSMMPHSIRGHPTWQRDQQNLTFALFQFDLLRSQSTSQDTLRDAFRELFYAFYRPCRPYLYQRVVTTAERKVLLFAASITCECTRRMCDEYTAELVRLPRKQKNGFDLVIIDSVVSPELLKEYEVNTIPTAIAIDRTNTETGRLEGGEHVRARTQELIGRMFGGSQ